MEVKHEQRQRRLRTWLVGMINSGTVEGLEWINDEKSMFKIPWKHESRNDWHPDTARIFTEWARFTGKYVEGRDKPDYKMFKTRLRCAFNKAPDIEEISDLRKYKGISPYRVYRLLKSDRKMPGSTVSDKKVISVARSSRPMNEAVVALRNKLFANSNLVPPHVESLRESSKALASAAEPMSDGEIDVESEYDGPYRGSSAIKREYNYQEDQKPQDTFKFNRTVPPAPSREIRYTPRQPKMSVALPLTSMPLSSVPQQIPLPTMPIATQPQQPPPPDIQEKLEKAEMMNQPLKSQQQQHPSSQQQLQHQQHHQQLPAKIDQAHELKADQAKGQDEKGGGDTASGDQQSLVLLQSTRYRSALLKNLHNLQKDGILCDLLLKSSGGEVIPVHANVMCASSPFFKEKVDHWEVGHSGDTMDSCMTIEFNTIPFDILNSIIQFVYMGEFEVARTSLPIVSNAAREMRLDDLIILCDHVLKALRNSGNLMDDKSGKPFLPKQAPLMGFPTAPSKSQPASSAPYVNQASSAPTYAMSNQQSIGSPPAKKAAMAPLIIPPPSQDDWHIPVGKGRLASSKSNGLAPNPLDVLCQAVDETIRSESNSDTEKSPMIIDEAENSQQFDKVDDGNSAYSPPALPITRAPPMSLVNNKPYVPITIQLPTNDQLQLTQSLSVQSTAKVASATPSDLSGGFKPSTGASPLRRIPVSTVAEANLLLPNDRPTIVPLPQAASELSSCDHKLGGVTGCASEESVGDNTNELYHVLPTTGLQTRPRRRANADGKGADENQIKNIIQRIKDRVPETDRVSNRIPGGGGVSGVQTANTLKLRRHSEVGTETQPIVIQPEEDRRARSTSGDRQRKTASANAVLTSGFPAGPVIPIFRSVSQPSTSENPIGEPRGIPLPEEARMLLFNCNECQESFSDQEVLVKHKAECQRRNYKHICDECGKRFRTRSTLNAHLQWHKSRKELTCVECNKVCKSKLLLKLHVDMHASGKICFRCDSCSKSFLTKKKLEQHVRDHIKEKRVEAPKATKPMMVNLEQEVTHKLTSSPKEPFAYFNDDMMDNIYHSQLVPVTSADNILPRLSTPPSMAVAEDEMKEDQVKKTMFVMKRFKSHTDDSKVQCQVCDAVVYRWNLAELEEHALKHAQDSEPGGRQIQNQAPSSQESQLLQCPVCNDAVFNKEELEQHFKEFHEDEFEAPLTPMERGGQRNRSATNTPLNSGMVTPPIGRSGEWRCNQCDETFLNQDSLQEHLLNHYASAQAQVRGGKGPLACPICNRIFSSKYANYEFKRHMCTHTGERPVPCRFCEKKFKDYSGRSQHEKRVHNRGSLPRGRRKGYKMDRDQLYSPPEPHHYLEDEIETNRSTKPIATNPALYETKRASSYDPYDTRLIEEDDIRRRLNELDDKAPPPLMKLSSLRGTLRKHRYKRHPTRDESSSDSGEDLSLITAVRGQHELGPIFGDRQSHMIRQSYPLSTPSSYLPINEVRPAPTTITSAAPLRIPPPDVPHRIEAASNVHQPSHRKPSVVKHTEHSQPTMYVRPPSFLEHEDGRQPIELLNHLKVSKGLPYPQQSNVSIARSGGFCGYPTAPPPSSYAHSPPTSRMMVAQLSESGVPHVTVEQHAIETKQPPPLVEKQDAKYSPSVGPREHLNRPPPLVINRPPFMMPSPIDGARPPQTRHANYTQAAHQRSLMHLSNGQMVVPPFLRLPPPPSQLGAFHSPPIGLRPAVKINNSNNNNRFTAPRSQGSATTNQVGPRLSIEPDSPPHVIMAHQKGYFDAKAMLEIQQRALGNAMISPGQQNTARQ